MLEFYKIKITILLRMIHFSVPGHCLMKQITHGLNEHYIMKVYFKIKKDYYDRGILIMGT